MSLFLQGISSPKNHLTSNAIYGRQRTRNFNAGVKALLGDAYRGERLKRNVGGKNKKNTFGGRNKDLPANSTKYKVDPNPLDMEIHNPNMQPQPHDEAKEVRRYVKRKILLLNEKITKPKGVAGPDGAEKLALWKREKSAWQSWLTQLHHKEVLPSVRSEFIQDFQNWLMGRGREIDHLRTGWYRTPITEDSVTNYLDAFINERHRFLAALAKLKSRPIKNVDEAYLYYKYIARQNPEEIPIKTFLSDWDKFSVLMDITWQGEDHPSEPDIRVRPEFPGAVSRQSSAAYQKAVTENTKIGPKATIPILETRGGKNHLVIPGVTPLTKDRMDRIQATQAPKVKLIEEDLDKYKLGNSDVSKWGKYSSKGGVGRAVGGPVQAPLVLDTSVSLEDYDEEEEEDDENPNKAVEIVPAPPSQQESIPITPQEVVEEPVIPSSFPTQNSQEDEEEKWRLKPKRKRFLPDTPPSTQNQQPKPPPPPPGAGGVGGGGSGATTTTTTTTTTSSNGQNNNNNNNNNTNNKGDKGKQKALTAKYQEQAKNLTKKFSKQQEENQKLRQQLHQGNLSVEQEKRLREDLEKGNQQLQSIAKKKTQKLHKKKEALKQLQSEQKKLQAAHKKKVETLSQQSGKHKAAKEAAELKIQELENNLRVASPDIHKKSQKVLKLKEKLVAAKRAAGDIEAEAIEKINQHEAEKKRYGATLKELQTDLLKAQEAEKKAKAAAQSAGKVGKRAKDTAAAHKNALTQVESLKKKIEEQHVAHADIVKKVSGAWKEKLEKEQQQKYSELAETTRKYEEKLNKAQAEREEQARLVARHKETINRLKGQAWNASLLVEQKQKQYDELTAKGKAYTEQQNKSLQEVNDRRVALEAAHNSTAEEKAKLAAALAQAEEHKARIFAEFSAHAQNLEKAKQEAEAAKAAEVEALKIHNAQQTGNLQQELNEVHKMKADLQAQLEQLHLQLQQERQEGGVNVAELERKIAESEQVKSQLSFEKHTILKQLEESKESNNSLTEQIAALKAEGTRLIEEKHSELQQQISAHQKAVIMNEQLQRKNEELGRAVNEAEALVQRISGQLQLSEQERNHLTQEIAKKQEELSAVSVHAQHASQQALLLAKGLDNIKESKDKIEAEAHALKSRLEESLVQREKEVQNLTEAKNQAEQALQKVIDKYNQDKENFEKQVKEYDENSKNHYAETLRDRESELDKFYKEDLERLKELHNDELAGAHEKLFKLENSNKSLHSRLKEKEHSEEQIQGEYEGAIAALESQVQQLKETLQQKEIEKQQTREFVEAAKDKEIALLKLQAQQSEEKARAWSETEANLKQLVTNLSATDAAQREKLALTEREAYRLAEELNQMKKLADETQYNLKRQEKKQNSPTYLDSEEGSDEPAAFDEASELIREKKLEILDQQKEIIIKEYAQPIGSSKKRKLSPQLNLNFEKISSKGKEKEEDFGLSDFDSPEPITINTPSKKSYSLKQIQERIAAEKRSLGGEEEEEQTGLRGEAAEFIRRQQAYNRHVSFHN